jgi:signal transduction histidine kinase
MHTLDSRATPRKKTLMHAFASDLGDTYDVKCMIRDISRDGCKIVSSHIDDLPETIKILPEGLSKPVFGKIVWKNDKVAGVKFLNGEDEIKQAQSPKSAAPLNFFSKMQTFASRGRRQNILQSDGGGQARSKRKGDFVAMMIHELRTPLTALTGAIGLLRAGALGELPAKVSSVINLAHRNAGRLTALVNDILDVRKIEAGRMSFDFKPIDLCALVAEAIESNEPYGAKYGVRFKNDSRIAQAWVSVDAHRIEQVLANFLSNAAKFAPHGSDVVVTTDQVGERVRICVSDSGPGIPADMHQKIFEKFAQAETSGEHVKDGTGLGLSISKAIVEGHGSAIHVASEPGKGAAFSFDLALVDAPAEAAIAPA